MQRSSKVEEEKPSAMDAEERPLMVGKVSSLTRTAKPAGLEQDELEGSELADLESVEYVEPAE